MFRRIALVLLMTAPATGQSLPLEDYPADAPVTLAQIHEAVGQYLRDPDSASYTGIVFVDGPLGKLACGWISWSNPVNGGYFEPVPFAARLTPDHSSIVADETAFAHNLVLRTPCAKPLGL
jgi:hypothetical protein